MKKKADANWVLISMVLAVIVLAITAYLFWKYSTESAKGATGIISCQSRGGNCQPCSATTGQSCACSNSDDLNVGQFTCAANQICCIPPQKEKSTLLPTSP